MRERAGWGLRLVRALLLALVTLLLAVVAHSTAGGLLPPPWTFGVMLVLATAGNALLLDREASRVEVVGLLVAGQTALHLALSALAGHRGEAPAGSASAGTAILDALHHVVADAGSQLPMTLAHLLAAVGSGLWLARGERALWTCLRTVANAARGVVVRVPGEVTPLLRRPAAPLPPALLVAGPPRLVHLRGSVVRRGPPVGRPRA